jgi:predicted SprT family Zn-dependent metalloprotease
MREQQIEDLIWKELERAMAIRPMHTWALNYNGWELTKAKTQYGQATSKGMLRISRIFLGTREFAQLRDTVRHEIAHLMCGMKAGHDVNWQHAARLLGCRPRATAEMQGELKRTAKKAWRLIGVLESGEEVSFRASHVKQSKYLKPNPRMSCSRGKIVSFHYVRNV